jgi:hypothetical protein
MEDAPEEPEFVKEIPEAVFGKVIKSRTFREALFAEYADVRQVLDEAGIYISDDGLRNLQALIAMDPDGSSLRPLDDETELV